MTHKSIKSSNITHEKSKGLTYAKVTIRVIMDVHISIICPITDLVQLTSDNARLVFSELITGDCQNYSSQVYNLSFMSIFTYIKYYTIDKSQMVKFI